MTDGHLPDRERGRGAPWARALTLALGILPSVVAGIDRADAQTTGASGPPSAFLTAPADGVDFYRKTETAARLVEEKKWAEAEALLLELTRAYPFSSAYAPSSSSWGRLGMALRQQGKHAAAIEAYKKVIELQGAGARIKRFMSSSDATSTPPPPICRPTSSGSRGPCSWESRRAAPETSGETRAGSSFPTAA